MRDRFKVSNESENRLSIEDWYFYTDLEPGKFLLDYYSVSTRPTTRHKYKIEKYYNRLDKRYPSIKREEAPILPWLLTALKNQIINEINKMEISEK